MRVTQAVLTDQALTAIRLGLARMARTQDRLSSARRIEVPSDDPAGHAVATRLSARLAATEQFRRQATAARTSLESAEGLLGDFVSLTGRAQELAVAGANGSLGTTERTSLAAEVDQLLEEAVALANTNDGRRYPLGGQETLDAPLSVTRNGTGQITAATWNPRGVDGAIEVDVADGLTVQTNVGGTSVLGDDADSTFLPALLVRLRDALAADDLGTVSGLIADLGTAQTRLGDAQGITGGRLRIVERALSDLDTEEVAARTALSAVQDADVASLAVELSQQEAVYRAALHAASRALQPSLLEFLR